MSGIFISYRREDASASAGRLYDHLVARLGQDRVFMDVDGLEPGVDFVDVINERVSDCDAIIAVIGRDWIDARLPTGERRLEQEDDFVRIEIAAGLTRDIRVIPVLVDGGRMPQADELPGVLKRLARRNAAEISHAKFSDDVGRLADVLERIVAPSEQEAAPVAPETPSKPSGGNLMAALERFNMVDEIHVGDSIPDKKVANARRKCQLPEATPVLALIDFTVMGNANDALLLTPDALVVHHSSADGPQPQTISMSVLRDGPIQKTGWWQIGIGHVRLTVSGGPDRDIVIDFLETVRAQLG